ncbi:dioxygenase [Aquirufa ecclesiirivi]|uniref:4,5-DOPA-extradiol-dioxygenase n=1 Tax=Aquirufa ecclesiirivi TaxID=2715124 RepID=UPI001409F9A1|nr:class III extradiol ring-cleavage dioxygenase [Aquirufa ecclesiirivi]NHC48893.1 dioxygenase [Aquirufa ecclesiirivi]
MTILPKELFSLEKTNHLQPVWFVGHGSPMNALADNPFTQHLNQLGKTVLEHNSPKAVLIVSAHWLTRGTFVQASSKPKIIYDFGGFPPALHHFHYPAVGDAEEANLLASQSAKIQATTEWGLDHGAWTVLCHLFPKAELPCFEVSIDYGKPLEYHVSLAQELQFLRERGVLILGSGNIVHNLRASMANLGNGREAFGYDWAQEFDVWSSQKIQDKDLSALINYEGALGGKESVPTPDHYIPMLYSLALARKGEEVHYTYDELVYGGISMRCFEIK